ncbi:hypothetical protein C8C98_2952 [Acidovorax sp. 106]|nr:hypothetical protein C8C98_2952 [Acidovorax sp. 106]
MARMKPLAFVASTFATAVLACHAPYAAAQASCSSDGTVRPTALFERFISADCEACWADPAAPAPSATTTVVLDWIVPSAQGDDAPLSAAATSDAVQRLQALGRPAPAGTDVAVSPVQPPARPLRLRVANGPPINDYLGTGIALARPPGVALPVEGWQYHLLLVEAVPAGSDGTAVARNLVRNMLYGSWNQRSQLSKNEHFHWMENRPMRIPTGAQPERLHMVGWLQDAQGRVLAAAQSVCR